MQQNPRSRSAGAQPAPSIVVAIFALQILLLTLGIHRDYQLKHEDNNALHATFARSHLHLGLERTRGQNYFYSPAAARGSSTRIIHQGPGSSLPPSTG